MNNAYYSGSMTLTIKASVISNNGAWAFYGANSNYYPSVTWTYTDVWSNTSGVNNSYVSASASTGSFVYNPLFKDGTNRNFKPTHRSPLRFSDGYDKEIGYEAYSGDQTPGYMGFYWENYQFPAGTYVIEGDIVVTGRKIPGSGVDPNDPDDDIPAKLTLIPGTIFKMATSDAMGGGSSPAKVEIVNHGTLEMDGTLNKPVKLMSNAGTPAANDWYAVIVPADAYATNVSEVVITHAQYGVRVEGSSHIIKNIDASICGTGVYVDGGTPEIKSMTLHDNQYGLYLYNTNAKVEDLIAHHNSADGLVIEVTTSTSRTNPVNGCMLYKNTRYGARLSKTSSGTLNVDINRCTIYGNTSHGINAENSYYSGSANIDIINSAVVSNDGYGIYSGSSSYLPIANVSYSDFWNNKSGEKNVYISWYEASGVFRYNPLFKDAVNADFTPTDRSPLRCAHQDAKSAAGYLPYLGDPTGLLTGYLHENMTLTAADSPYLIPGDLIVDNKCSSVPVTLTIEAGAVLLFDPQADLMGGGTAANRGELRVIDSLVIDGTTAQAQIISGAATPAKGDWTGIVLDSGSTVNAKGFLVEWAQTGINGVNATTNLYSKCVIRNSSSWGIYFPSGAGGTIEDCQILSNGSGGVYMKSLTGSPVIRRNVILDNMTANCTSCYAVHAVDTSVDVINNVLMGATTGFYGQKTGSTSVTFDLWNNTIHEHSSDCIYTNNSYYSGSMTLRAKNNLLTYCKGYAVKDAGSYDVIATEWDYNDFFETYNYQTGNSHYGINKGTHDTSLNPRYEDIDPSGKRRWYDLRLLKNSPMIDAGTATGDLVPTHDLLMVVRPKLGGIDIGAYEYDPSGNHDPWADAGADQLVAMLDNTCFDAKGSTDPDSDSMTYAWSFGDGQQASGKVVCHVFTNNIVHEVILTVTDEHGGVDHDVLAVDVNRRPIADAGPEVYADAGGDAAEFDGTNSKDLDGTIASYFWDFGDGTGTSTEAAPSYKYAAGPSKDFIVWLTVTDNDGHSSQDYTIAHITGTTDTVGPLIVHTPIGNGRPEGIAVDIQATISDPSDVDGAEVIYRKTGATGWNTATMTNIGGTTWKGTIPAGSVTPDGVDYYIKAIDKYTPKNTSTDPDGAPASYHHFTVNPVDNVGPAITHTPIANGQPEGKPVTVKANVTDPSGVSTVKLFYKVTTGSTYASTAMSGTGDNNYQADIPAVVVTSAGVDYYIEATDSAPSGNKSTSPASAPVNPHHFSVNVTDMEGPAISHTPVANGQIEKIAVPVVATITDISGIELARLHYRMVGDTVFQSVPMTANGSTYSATIPAQMVTTKGVQYYIYAQDNSAGHNASLSPNTAPSTPYTFTVSSTDTSGPSIAHTPVTNGQPAGIAVNITAAVVDGSGVASVTLYYRLLGDTIWTVQVMTKASGDNWQGIIADNVVKVPGIQYYIKAIDSSPASNVSVAPGSAPGNPYQFTVKVDDVTPPDVNHTPVQNGQISGKDITVTATATDSGGINSVTLYYRTYGGSFSTAPMSLVSADTYGAKIPGASVTAPSVDYYILAIDGSTNNNKIYVPASAPATPFTFTVTPADNAGPTITHTAVENGQIVNTDVQVSAHITDASGLKSVTLYYRTAGDMTWDSAAMTPSLGDNYLAKIPAAKVKEAGVQYYIKAVDASPAENASVNPETAPSTPYSFTVVKPDTEGPKVTHTPVSNNQPSGKAVTILADVTDNSGPTGVASVTLFYKPVPETAYSAVEMALTTGNTWQGAIPSFAVTDKGINYFIVAKDKADPQNATYAPSTAPSTPYSFTVLPADTKAPSLSHTPVSDGQTADKAVSISATATDESGIASVILYFRVTGTSPYASVAMTDENSDNIFTGEIPAYAVTGDGVDYYITATDASPSANKTTLPATAPSVPYDFTVVVPDIDPPVITHNPVADGQPVGLDVTIQAFVSDTSGLASVKMYYRVSGGQWNSKELTDNGSGTYSGTVPGASVTTAGVEYYIEATDLADPPNTADAPETAPEVPYSFMVTTTDTSGPSIAHVPVANGQKSGEKVEVKAGVSDPSGVASVTLHYRITGTQNFTSQSMNSSGGNIYAGEIPSGSVTPAGVDYYIRAVDSSAGSNMTVEPSGAPASTHHFTVTVPDTTPPQITHTQIKNGQVAGVNVAIEAVVTDASGVASVTLYYRPVGSIWSLAPLTNQGGGSWTGAIPGYAVTTAGVQYYLAAVDSAAPSNKAYAPATAPDVPYSFTVTQGDETGPSISHVPVADGQSAGKDVEVKATVTDSSGIASVTLYYRTSGTLDFKTTTMTSTGGNLYSGTIPSTSVKSAGVDYYLKAVDKSSSSNVTYEPAGAPSMTHHFTVISGDTEGPSIVHTKITDGQISGTMVSVEAEVEDVSSVASVTVYARPSGTSVFTEVSMSNTAGKTWKGTIPSYIVISPGVDYYLRAEDSAEPSNVSFLPSQGKNAPYSFTVVPADNKGPGITHTPVADGQEASKPVAVNASVTDPSGVVSVSLYFRPTGTIIFAVTAMVSSGSSNWSGTIPAYAVTQDGVDYYIQAVDASVQANVSTDPSNAPANFHSFTTVVKDEKGPSIVHLPLDDGQPAGKEINVSAVVTDQSGVDEVKLYYRKEGTENWTEKTMTEKSDVYHAAIPAGDVVAPVVEYYLYAADLAEPANVSFAPASGADDPYSFTVTAEDEAGPVLTVTPVDQDQPWGKDVTVSADASDASGVESVILYYRDAEKVNYTMISMNEISKDKYQGVIPADDVTTEEIEYYVRAVDASKNSNESIWPSTAPDTPASFTVAGSPDNKGPDLTVTTVPDNQPEDQAVNVSAVAKDPGGVVEVRIYYRIKGEDSFGSVVMSASAEADTYSAEIPAFAVKPPSVEYYVTATDASASANKTYKPDGAPANLYSFTVKESEAKDELGPVIAHIKPTGDHYEGESVVISAIITDSSGVAWARLNYQPEGKDWKSMDMMAGSDNKYTATITGSEVLRGNMSYYIEAQDSSPAANISYAPHAGKSDPFIMAISAKEKPSTSGGCSIDHNDNFNPYGWLIIMIIVVMICRISFYWRKRERE
jgi:hypothetical protein